MGKSLLVVPLVAVAGCRVEAGVNDLTGAVSSSRAALGGIHKIHAPGCDAPAPPSTGHVVFRLNDRVYRLETTSGAHAEEISAGLDRIGLGKDGFINTSADGEWLLVETSRFGCGEQMCLTVVNRTACAAEVVVADHTTPAAVGYAAIGPTGNLVVYPAEGGPHKWDLYAITRKTSTAPWSSPLLLTRPSPYAYHKQPSLSPDGRHVVFDCGDDPGEGEGTNICQVATDGTGLVQLVSQEGPAGLNKSGNHHPAYAPDGSVVFEGTWHGSGEQIWRKAPGTAPRLVNGEITDVNPTVYRFSNDNSPCVMPDGRIVSLWLGRPGNGSGPTGQSKHEIKVMDADGGNPGLLAIGIDVVDVGIGCSK